MTTSAGILDNFGRPVSAERVKIERSERFNPLANWGPEVLMRQLVAYQRGEIAALSWVMEWLETHDEVIQTVAPKAKAAVCRHGYDIALKDELRPEQKGMAEDQQGRVQEFCQNVQVGDAVDLEVGGGMRLLFQQTMDAYGKGYAAHHTIWRPGKTLSAEILKVPTWFFELKTGRMQFLPNSWANDGVPLDTLGGRNAWMISRGRGVMLAGAIARMFKQLPLQDWLTYCDRHGMPAFLGKTKAKKGSAEWNDMVTAIQSIGSEWGAVTNVDDIIDVLDLKGSGELPYEKLVDRMDRAQIMLWRGGDLGTISRDNGTGSNPQQDEADELDCDNAEWVSETLTRNLTDRVVKYYYGQAPVLVKLKLRTKSRDNVVQDLATTKAARELGCRISKPWFLGKFGIVEADAGEAALGDAPAPAAAATTTALNAAAAVPESGAAEAQMQELRSALATDMQPLGDALWAAYQTGDLPALRGALKKISAAMPDYALSSELESKLAGQMAAAFLS